MAPLTNNSIRCHLSLTLEISLVDGRYLVGDLLPSLFHLDVFHILCILKSFYNSKWPLDLSNGFLC